MAPEMTVEEFIALRKAYGMTQTEFGAAIGLSLRSISEIENGSTKLRLLHILAAERIALELATLPGGKPMAAPMRVRQQAIALARALGAA